MFRNLTVLAALSLATTAVAQPSFVEVSPTSDLYFSNPDTEDFWINVVAPADVDGDGDLDLAVLGYFVIYNQSAEDRLMLLLNQGADALGNWQFSHVQVPLGAVFAGASDLAWGDFDGDGDPDLALGSEGMTVLYRNDGGALLTPLPNLLPGYEEDSSYSGSYDLRSLSWADADNDGDLDLLVPSTFDHENFVYQTKLVSNGGPDGAGGWLFTESSALLDPTTHAQSAWADDDGDGDLDLFLTNVDPYLESGFIKRYTNDGGTFTGQDLLGVRVNHGLADWGDYDADRDLDLLVAGNIQEVDQSFNTVLRVYRNDGGAYTETTLIQAPNADWLDIHAATWADYDSDGDIDILATGNHVGDGEIVGHSQIFANNGGTFTPLGVQLPAPYSSIGQGGSFTWLDIDGDGDLDYLVAGGYFVPGGNGLVEAQMHLYRNMTTASNAPPSLPTGLGSNVLPGVVTLTWQNATDEETPSAALTYELELFAAGQSTPVGEHLPQPGNLGTVTHWTLSGLPPGSYSWSLRAVDSAFHDGGRAQGVFTVSGGAAIFADGFESGTTEAWSLTVP